MTQKELTIVTVFLAISLACCSRESRTTTNSPPILKDEGAVKHALREMCACICCRVGRVASGASVSIGDVDSDTDYTRCVVSFDLSPLPAGVDIQSAVPRVYQTDQSPTGNGYAVSPIGLEDVLVDNIIYWPFTPDANLFSAAFGQNIGTLATSFSANTWHELDVTASAVEEVNQTQSGRLQFRPYHHYANNNKHADTDDWVMGDSPTHQPELVMTYT